jgi:hypothetical protein
MKEDYSTLTAEIPIVVHVFMNKVDLGNNLIKVSFPDSGELDSS